MIPCYACNKPVSPGGTFVAFCNDDCRRVYWKHEPIEIRTKPRNTVEEIQKRLRTMAQTMRQKKVIDNQESE